MSNDVLFGKYCDSGEQQLAIDLLEKGIVDINGDYFFPLIFTCSDHKDNHLVVKYLLENGYDFNKETWYGYTGFLYALIMDRLKTIDVFIDKKIPLPMNDIKFNRAKNKVLLPKDALNKIKNLENFEEFRSKTLFN